jgi:hypothetical protein
MEGRGQGTGRERRGKKLKEPREKMSAAQGGRGEGETAGAGRRSGLTRGC